MIFNIKIGDKVKFKKVKGMVDNKESNISKGKWYKIIRTKYQNPNKSFVVIDNNGEEFYISFYEHNHIKKIKRGDKNG